jgi:hypothetical protein
MNTTAAPPMPAEPLRKPFGVARVLLIVFGSLALVVAVGSLAVGAAALWAVSERDDSGYLTTEAHRLGSGGYAIASENLDVADVPRWVGDHFATVRIEASSDKPVFVGIGRTREVERYLAGVPHSQIADLEADPFSVDYRQIAGTREPAEPGKVGFWRAQAPGAGTQTITWPLADGDWSVVAMNADGSRGVTLDAAFGAKVSALGWVVFGFLAGGGLVLVLGATLVYLGVRKPRNV